MKFGRLIRVGQHRSDQDAVIFVVAEPDPARALDLIRDNVAEAGDDVEDLGRVTSTLLDALTLKAGEFHRT
jgi:hypothetical protein